MSEQDQTKYIAGKPISPESRFQKWIGDVHVRISGLGSYDLTKQSVIDHIKAFIDPLDLDINLVFDDDVTYGGINFIFRHRGKQPDPFTTRETTAYTSYQLGPHKVAVPHTVMDIRIDLDIINEYKPDDSRQYAFYNVIMHELIHALFIKHHLVEHTKVPRALMRSKLSSDKLYWTFNDEQLLLQKYGKQGEGFTFDDTDIGKHVHIIYKGRKKKQFSISRKITDNEMYITNLPNGRRKIVIE
jgi:hypothetical protein